MGYRSEVAVRVLGDSHKLETLRDTMILRHRAMTDEDKQTTNVWLTRAMFNEAGGDDAYTETEHIQKRDCTEEYVMQIHDVKWYSECENWYDNFKALAESAECAVESIRVGEESGDIEHDYTDNIDDYGGTIMGTSTVIQFYR